MHRRRVWVALAGICAGILMGGSTNGYRALWLVAVPAATLAARRPRVAGVLGLLALAVLAGMADAGLRERATTVERLAADVPVCRVEGRVLEHQGGLGTYLLLERAACAGNVHEDRLGTVVADGTIGEAGGRFHGIARLVPLTRSSFDSARRKQGASASIRSPELRFTPPSSPARYVAARVRRGLVEATGVLDGRRAALLRGLTIGDTQDMDADATLRFRRAGLTHLVAVSGSNLAIVVGAIAWLLSPAGVRLRAAGSAAGLVLFVLVVGPEPSVLRAGAMGAIAIAAVASGRIAEPLDALGLALVVVLLWRPGLLTSPGLQLSAAATAGLVLWSGSIAARLPLPRPLALVAGATLAAQIAVAPVLILVFGQLSLIAPLANVLAVPAVAPATVLGMVAGAAAPINLSLAGLVARAAEPFSWWILTVGDLTGGSSWAALDVPRALGWVVAVPVVAGAWRALRRRASAGVTGPVARSAKP